MIFLILGCVFLFIVIICSVLAFLWIRKHVPYDSLNNRLHIFAIVPMLLLFFGMSLTFWFIEHFYVTFIIFMLFCLPYLFPGLYFICYCVYVDDNNNVVKRTLFKEIKIDITKPDINYGWCYGIDHFYVASEKDKKIIEFRYRTIGGMEDSFYTRIEKIRKKVEKESSDSQIQENENKG